MSTVTATAPTTTEATEPDQCVTLRGIGWDGYNRMLRLRGSRSRPRMIYLDGDLLLMSPGHSHERDKERFGVFIVVIAEELNIPFLMAGSTTYRRRKRRGGVEPDQSYYLANAPRVLNKKDIDLRINPPPDLTIEVVYSHSAENAVEASRRLGVPEMWVCDDEGLKFLVLGADGRHAESPRSLAFPFLTAPEIVAWVRRPEVEGATDIDWIKDLRRWTRETLSVRDGGRAEPAVGGDETGGA